LLVLAYRSGCGAAMLDPVTVIIQQYTSILFPSGSRK